MALQIPLDLAHDMTKHLKKLTDGGSPLIDTSQTATHLLLANSASSSTLDELSRSVLIESLSFKTPKIDNDDALDTCMSFAENRNRSNAAPVDHSQILAEVHAHVEALPDSKKKEKLLAKLRKFHASSDDTQQTSKMKRSKRSKRQQIAALFSSKKPKMRRVDEAVNDDDEKENSFTEVDQLRMDGLLKQTKKKSISCMKDTSFDPTKIYAMFVPCDGAQSSALRNFCVDEYWDQLRGASPVLQSTFVKHNKF